MSLKKSQVVVIAGLASLGVLGFVGGAGFLLRTLYYAGARARLTPLQFDLSNRVQIENHPQLAGYHFDEKGGPAAKDFSANGHDGRFIRSATPVGERN